MIGSAESARGDGGSGWTRTSNQTVMSEGGNAMDGEAEPSIGWCQCEAQTGGYSKTGYQTADLEDEHCGREPDADFEPEETDHSATSEDEPIFPWRGGCDRDAARGELVRLRQMMGARR